MERHILRLRRDEQTKSREYTLRYMTPFREKSLLRGYFFLCRFIVKIGDFLCRKTLLRGVYVVYKLSLLRGSFVFLYMPTETNYIMQFTILV